MPDALFLLQSQRARSRLEQVAEQQGFRSKFAADAQQARDWLQLRKFDVLVCDSSLKIAALSDLADSIWPKEPLLSLLVCSEHEKLGEFELKAKLRGAEILKQENIESSLAEHLAQLAREKRKLKQADFKVLVVEDLESPRDIMCAYLESLGFPSLAPCATAGEAMQELESHGQEFHCVITDVRMPEIDGRDLITYIRRHARFQHLPIIVLTAYGTADCLVDCLKAGASGFLVKPPGRVDLTRELARAMRIACKLSSPRLASTGEADLILEHLLHNGYGNGL